jgi:hypothetical protein
LSENHQTIENYWKLKMMQIEENILDVGISCGPKSVNASREKISEEPLCHKGAAPGRGLN